MQRYLSSFSCSQEKISFVVLYRDKIKYLFKTRTSRVNINPLTAATRGSGYTFFQIGAGTRETG